MATGSLGRSSYTVSCIWTYLAHESRWAPEYFQAIGLGDLADAALALGGKASDGVSLARDLQVVPEFMGNRAPFADPQARAVIMGQGMDANIPSLVALYVAGICGLGYGLRQIIEAQASHGAPGTSIAISGGAGQHPLIRQVLADATGLPVEATICAEPVLLGSAILGSVAARKFEGLKAAMPIMSRIAQVFEPSGTAIARIHDQRFAAVQKLQTAARDIRRAANGSAQ